MKNLSLIIAILCFLSATIHTKAQTWTTEEQEIIKRVETSWISWQDAINQNDLSIWLKATNPIEDWSCWWTQDGALWDLSDTKRNFELFIKDVRKYYWMNFNPLSIKVYEDVAFIWFYTSYAIEDKNGITTNTEEKRFEVYRKIDGEWKWSAGMAVATQLN